MAHGDYDAVSWREFRQFLDTYNSLARRVESMDQGGTRGVAVIQVQVTGLTKQLSDLETDMRTWQVAHSATHDAEATRRLSGRRWAVGTAIACLGALIALITMVGALLAGQPF